MKQITNIYILVDTSFRNERNKEKLQTILNKYSRALNFEKGKAKLHIIGYNDKKSRLWLSNAVCCGCPVCLVLRKCGIVVMSLRILVNF